ncbi:MAG: alkanesulfonate transporter substrate-binding subunit [Candidatus Methanofastidiosum methylothiophilum]|uniref:Alkanesulfonate transporter substrate-binding subunit n=1 Tax=Candidatus Methanofastidiosum methylothiophilum TaxID=1705564 RepID=A0A150IJT5_9EURY|nr:MAG: alkanesulfonate transporter substrate-binding subunit [Candidatus Methanofastidiosum methylthiophilus]KYC46992.1 MAG: alkanesulfonate transporter substrate-binding subunit [Candidatus Methanofastidiosum methylthiophilus]KYC49645.1 MAG: alkanesulfonate transporter substrate-binding subunit [Candidatus Methanofastidiosum methylthiophilus]
MKKIFAILASILIVSTLLAGCVGQGGGDTKKMTELKIGYQPSTHQIAEMIAMEKGWWQNDLKKFGIVKVTDYEFPSGPPEMQAMLAGQIDIAYVGATPPIPAIDQGLDAKIVAAAQGHGSDIVIWPESTYTGPSYFVGKKIGTFPPGSIQDMVLKKWLMDNGIDVSKVDIRAMGPGDATTALTAKQIDAVFLPHPSPAILEINGNGKSVVKSGEMWEGHACCVLLVSGKLIRENPELVKEIIRIHIKATEYINENPEEAAEIASRKLGLPKETVLYSMKNSDTLYFHDPNELISDMEEYAKEHYSLGYTKKLLTAKDLVDTKLYDEVTKK